MRDAISDPTAGQRARDIRDFPSGLRRRVDPTDPRYRRGRLDGGQAMPNRDPTDPTYGPDLDDRAVSTGQRRGRRHHAAPTDEDPM